MKILILGKSEYKINELIKLFLDDMRTKKIHIFYEDKNKIINNKKVEIFEGNVENLDDLEFDKEYDLVVDYFSLMGENIEKVISSINIIKKYIYISSYQAYRFIEEKQVLHEECVDKEYREKVENRFYYPEDKMGLYAYGKLDAEKYLNSGSEKKIKEKYILRIGKVLSKDDPHLMVSWILSRIRKNYPIILKKSDVLEMSSFSPIFFEDLMRLIQKISMFEHEGGIFNICQDKIITLFDMIKFCKEYYESGSQTYIIDDDEFEDGYLREYIVPIQSQFIMSNQKMRQEIGFNTRSYEENMEKLLSKFTLKKPEKFKNSELERRYIKGDRIVSIGQRNVYR